MKTSASQFELMVSFMEEHGDLSKPSSNASGRLRTFKNWEELTNLLNGDGGGDTKTTDKWKKVWSDFKNNTKKKAARLHKAAMGTGGGPAVFLKLTDLEQRVLKLVGMQVATGLPAEEAGLSQIITNPPRSPQPTQMDSQILHSLQPANNGPAIILNVEEEENIQAPPVEASISFSVENFPARSDTQPNTTFTIRPISSPPHVFEEMQVLDPDRVLPTRPVTPAISGPQPARSGSTPRRSRLGRALASPHHSRTRQAREPPRRRMRPAHTEEAAQHFLNSDENWRNFRIRQHEDINRIRVMEIQRQQEWQALGERLINILEKFVNYHCK